MKKSWNSHSQQWKKELPLHTTHTAFSRVVTCLSVVRGFRLLPEQLHLNTLSSRGWELATQQQNGVKGTHQKKYECTLWEAETGKHSLSHPDVAFLCMHVRCMHAIVTFITGVCCHVQLFALQLGCCVVSEWSYGCVEFLFTVSFPLIYS